MALSDDPVQIMAAVMTGSRMTANPDEVAGHILAYRSEKVEASEILRKVYTEWPPRSDAKARKG